MSLQPCDVFRHELHTHALDMWSKPCSYPIVNGQKHWFILDNQQTPGIVICNCLLYYVTQTPWSFGLGDLGTRAITTHIQGLQARYLLHVNGMQTPSMTYRRNTIQTKRLNLVICQALRAQILIEPISRCWTRIVLRQSLLRAVFSWEIQEIYVGSQVVGRMDRIRLGEASLV